MGSDCASPAWDGQTLHSMRRSRIRLHWRLIARPLTTFLVAARCSSLPGIRSLRRDQTCLTGLAAFCRGVHSGHYMIIYVVNRLYYRKQRAEARNRRVAKCWSRVRDLWHTRIHPCSADVADRHMWPPTYGALADISIEHTRGVTPRLAAHRAEVRPEWGEEGEKRACGVAERRRRGSADQPRRRVAGRSACRLCSEGLFARGRDG